MENASYLRLVEGYKEWLGLIGYSPDSIDSMPGTVKSFLLQMSERQRFTIEEITRPDILSWYEVQRTRPSKSTGEFLKNSTLNGMLRTLRLFARYLQETGQGTLEIDLMNEPKARAKKDVLSRDEILQLYNVVQQDVLGLRDRAILHLYYGCGLRSNEGRHLNLDDVMLDKSLIFVRRGKGYKERYVPLVDGQIHDLSMYLEKCRPELAANKEEKSFLLNGLGRRPSYNYLLQRLKILIAKAGSESILQKKIGLHNLRHSIATELLNEGMEIEEISRFLGHKNISSTEVYTHVFYENQYR